METILNKRKLIIRWVLLPAIVALHQMTAAGEATSGIPTYTTMIIDSEVVLTQHTTYPQTTSLVFEPGGYFKLNGYNLNIKGSLNAGNFQIFDFSNGGTVQFGDYASFPESPHSVIPIGSVNEINPYWFGVRSSPTYDNGPALRDLFENATHGANIVFPAGIYRTRQCNFFADTHLTGLSIKGASPASTMIWYDRAGNCGIGDALFRFTQGTGAILFEKIQLKVDDYQDGLDYTILMQAENPEMFRSMKDVTLRDVYLFGAHRANYRVGRMSESTQQYTYSDIDGFNHNFINVRTYPGIHGANDYIFDAMNIVDIVMTNVMMGNGLQMKEKDDGSLKIDVQYPGSHILLLNGEGLTMTGGFACSMDRRAGVGPHHIIEVGAPAGVAGNSPYVNVFGLDAEEHCLLENWSTKANINISGFQTSTQLPYENGYCHVVDSRGGNVALRNVSFDKGGACGTGLGQSRPHSIRSDGTLIADNVRLGNCDQGGYLLKNPGDAKLEGHRAGGYLPSLLPSVLKWKPTEHTTAVPTITYATVDTSEPDRLRVSSFGDYHYPKGAFVDLYPVGNFSGTDVTFVVYGFNYTGTSIRAQVCGDDTTCPIGPLSALNTEVSNSMGEFYYYKTVQIPTNDRKVKVYIGPTGADQANFDLFYAGLVPGSWDQKYQALEILVKHAQPNY